MRENGNVTFYAGRLIACKSGEWHHLAFTWGDAIRCYYDGECVLRGRAGGLPRPCSSWRTRDRLASASLTCHRRGAIRRGARAGGARRAAGGRRAHALPGAVRAVGERQHLPTREGPAGSCTGATLVEGRFEGPGDEHRGMAGYTKLDRLAEMGVRTVCSRALDAVAIASYTTPENEPKLAELVSDSRQEDAASSLWAGRSRISPRI